MIFLTVGTQLPFDRLTSTVDAWCGETGKGVRVFGQVGHLGTENYRPKHFKWAERVDPDAFDRHVREASVIVSHAGMGSIITAMSCGKPIVILPRRAHLGEQRNDHQFATAERFGNRPGVYTAMTEGDVPGLLDHVTVGGGKGDITLSPFADPHLIETLRAFIHGDDKA